MSKPGRAGQRGTLARRAAGCAGALGSGVRWRVGQRGTLARWAGGALARWAAGRAGVLGSRARWRCGQQGARAERAGRQGCAAANRARADRAVIRQGSRAFSSTAAGRELAGQ
ncbi:unnamed protein product [Closterium sp. NIES-64]|nr:unnamed protein product [Closterium sp. NIES-64]